MVQQSLVDRLIPLGPTCRWCLWFCLPLFLLGGFADDTCRAQDDPVVNLPERRPEKPLAYWLEQLSSDRYLRRQKAERLLVEAGTSAVPLLKDHLPGADLESVERVISILAKIAANEDPLETEGAIAALESVAEKSFGAKAGLAASTLASFFQTRSEQARLQLMNAGIFVGTDSVPIGSRSMPQSIVRIDRKWDGNLEPLAWLRWLGDVELAELSGPRINRQVVEAIARMPDLKIVAFDDCKLTADAIDALKQGPRLNVLEIRYSPLGEDHLKSLAELRLRESLHLMGTEVTEPRVMSLRAEMPGVEVTLRKGGFLGVVCRNTFQDFCEVNEVIPAGGAALAGLLARDIVVQIDDVKIKDFDDLQRQINKHVAGDEVAIRYQRGGQIISTRATLQRQNQQ
ncbi:MAG: PDZ domain-containing protein [Planctomycetota bacterium]